MAEPNEPSINRSGPAPGDTQRIDFWRFYSAVTKRLWIVAVIFAGTASAVAFWTFHQPKIYRAEASVVIDPNPPDVLKGVSEVVDIGVGNYWQLKEYIETQYRILKSRT